MQFTDEQYIREIERQRRAFLYYLKTFPLDSLAKHVCNRIEKWFANDRKNLKQALWVYVNANSAMRNYRVALNYPWRSRQRIIRLRSVQAQWGFLHRDLLRWEA